MANEDWFEAVPGTRLPVDPPSATYAYWQHRDSGAIVLVLADATGHALHYTERPLHDAEIRQAYLVDGGPAHWYISYTSAEADWDDGEWVLVMPPYPGDAT